VGGEWFAAWVIATVVALIATPLLARQGRSRRRRRRASLATAGGPLLAVLAALPLVVPDLEVELAAVLLAALGLWVVGQLLERDALPSSVRKVAIGIAATIAVLAGVRIDLVGVGVVDSLLTIAVIWGATSAWRSAQTRDGLLLGWAAVIATGAALLGGLGSQPGFAVAGAAVVGASFGFLPYVLPPVAARLRRGGAWFLGFLAVALAVSVEPAAPGLRRTLTQMLLVSIPLLEGAIGAAARRRGRGGDPRLLGLVGRWRALGLPRLAVTLGLVALQAALVVVALLVGRGVIELAPALLISLVILALVVLPTVLVRLDAPPGRWPRWVFLGTSGVAVLFVVLAAPAALALIRARSDTSTGAKAAERALAAARRGDAKASDAAFRDAERSFTAAERRLDGVPVSLGRVVPLLGPNLDAARTLVDVGVDLSRVGRQLTTTADPDQLRIVDSTVNLSELARLRPEFERTARVLTAAQDRMNAIDTTFLISPIEDAIAKVHDHIDRAARDSRTAAISSRILPGILGGRGNRRYFLAMQNNSEARAAGGFIGNYAELTARNGKVDMGDVQPIRTLNPAAGDKRTLHAPKDYVLRYGRFSPERVWQNVNASPDVPTVGGVEASLLAQGPFGPVDGVVTVDPEGLAAILRITGPIRVPGWPNEVTADNVMQATLHDSYDYFSNDNDARESFLGDVANAAWDAFSKGNLGSPAKVVKELAKATRTKHLTLWFKNPKEESLAKRAHAAGVVPRTTPDLALVTTGNAAQNKIDYYLKRRLRYDLQLFPQDGADDVEARASMRVGLENTAPASGQPSYVIGPNRPDYAAGENGTFFSAYSPLELQHATLDGKDVGMEHGREFGRQVYSRFLRIPAKSTTEVGLDLAGKLQPRDGWYELALGTQPSVNPDMADVSVRLPSAWRFADASGGLTLSDNDHVARYVGKLDRDRRLRVRIVADHGDGLWGRVQDARPL
jgi:hypothetical protein